MAGDGDRAWVGELQPGIDVEESYVVRSKDLRQRRGGGPYLALTLGDRTGEVAALVWENVDTLGKVLEVGAPVVVTGQVQRYNQRLQVVVRRAVRVPADQVDESLYVRSSTVDPDVLWQRLEGLVEEVDNPHLRQLLYRILSDPEVRPRLRVAPAARAMHHAFRSGLLEHTVSMATIGRQLARHYRLDESLVVTGCVLHDLGKVWELDIGASIEYSDDGRLLGHLTMEVLHVDRVIADLPSFPEELRRQLLHLLLAHHGEYEYGSPRRPKTPEALLVHVVDLLDSKMAGMMEAINADGDAEQAWSPYSRILDRYVYRRRPPTE
ncbi:MAG TPA: HD domain-containing protein [Candidatus Sulfomarinibacteraceae bacterium]|nr:HD domain-containing protein [Candidatus Sulfomarinibacteraceae bacterium]